MLRRKRPSATTSRPHVRSACPGTAEGSAVGWGHPARSTSVLPPLPPRQPTCWRASAPGQSIDEALAAYEASIAGDQSTDEEADSASEPVSDARLEPITAETQAEAIEEEPVAAQPELEPVQTEPLPQPIAAAPGPTPEPTVEAPPIAAAVDTPAPARDDRVEVPVWQIVAPDSAGQQPVPPAPQPASPPVRAAGEPQWPTTAAVRAASSDSVSSRFSA